MQDWFTHNDIDYVDMLMMGVAAMCGIPAAILICYGTFSAVTNGARLMASVFI